MIVLDSAFLMIPFTIAGIQMQISGREDNLARIRAKIDHTMHMFPQVRMIVLPELAAFGPSTAKAQPLPGPAERTFQEIAARHKVWLVNGSMFESHEGKVYNTCSVIDPEGKVAARYRKAFPFRPYEAGVEAGDSFCVFDVPRVGRFGVLICYDLWFPEAARALAALGAEVLVHPVMTTTIDRDIELAMAVATAAQQQCYVFEVNGVGDGGVGQSIIVDPDAVTLYRAGSGEEILPLELDLARVRRSREFGVRGLGQVLKSFRDRRVLLANTFDLGERSTPAWDTLGPLRKPGGDAA